MKSSLILVAVIIGLFYSLPAQDVTTFRIAEINSGNLQKGELIQVPLYIDNVSETLTSFLFFVEFDTAVLEYKRTTDIKEIFKKGWQENITEYFYAAIYMDMMKSGKKENQAGKFCTLEFLYKGGESTISWGKENIIENSIKKMGKTEAIGISNNNLNLKLIDGCVCKTK